MRKIDQCVLLDTFTSFSWDKKCAYKFAGYDGCILKLDFSKQPVFPIADVSWISKFDDEKEFLAERGFWVDIWEFFSV